MSDPIPVVRVLFVCTGNTCRSPLAAAALRVDLGDDLAHIEVSSAGTSAAEGQRVSAGSADVAASEDIDLSSHRARRVNAEMLAMADFVFVMEPLHRVALDPFHLAVGKVQVLSEWPEPGEPELAISDPFGASREAYEECWRRIRRHVRRIAPLVQHEMRTRLTS